MRIIGLSTVLGLLAGCSGQQLANTLTPTFGLERERDIAYGELPRQKLDLYWPKDVTEDTAVVLFFYGGRWSEGERDGYLFLAQALVSRGFIVAVPDYRLYPEVKFPAFVEDGAAAVAWVRNVLPEKLPESGPLFLMGHSAGAHIAAMLTLHSDYLEAVGQSPGDLAGMIGLAGPYDFLPLEADDLRDIFDPPENYPASQPINYVNGNNPPLLLLHGDRDKSVFPKNSRNLAAAVEKAGGRVDYRLYEGVDHIRIIGNFALPLRWSGQQLDDVQAFIDSVTADERLEATVSN